MDPNRSIDLGKHGHEDGRVISIIKRSVSSDGRALTFVATVKTDSRKDFTETTVYTRTSPEKSGLVGTWKPVSVHADTPDVLTFRVTPDGALSYAGAGESFSAKPDGNRYPLKSDLDSVSLRFSGDRSISFTFFMKGKALDIETLTLSKDGQSFTGTERNANSNTPNSTRVYQKQP